MKFSGLKFSFRSRMAVIVVGVVIATLSLVYTYKLADILRQKEQNDVNLWVAAMERVSREAFGNYLVDPLISHIVSTHNNIPFIITDENLTLVMSNRIDEDILHEVGKKFKYIVTLEDGTVKGGLGTAVAEFMALNGYNSKVEIIGIPDKFIEHGSPEELYRICGMDKESVLGTLLKFKEIKG